MSNWRAEPRAAAAVKRALERIDYTLNLLDRALVVDAEAEARVSWLTDPEMAALPRNVLRDLQMHMDSAWIALSAGNAEFARTSLAHARRVVGY